jgi:hypothetical protein
VVRGASDVVVVVTPTRTGAALVVVLDVVIAGGLVGAGNGDCDGDLSGSIVGVVLTGAGDMREEAGEEGNSVGAELLMLLELLSQVVEGVPKVRSN